MNTKRAIKRMLLTLMWLGVAIGMFTIIAATMKEQQQSTCTGYDITISGAQGSSLFTTKDQIIKLLEAATHGAVKGQRKSDFNLPQMEDLLEQSVWVYNAELYFDNRNILKVNVVERKPLARVFTINGESFYIDEAGKQIPLSNKITLNVPVFTGYPDKKVMNATDTALLENMIATASFINTDSFWVSQVSQIDIRNCGPNCWDMEMVPTVGNHRVDLGDGSDIATKFHRLYLFYDQVLKRTGFDKYQRIDVQYNGQVVGIKGNYTKVDSVQLRNNIEDLLRQSRESNDVIAVANTIPGTHTLYIDTSAAAKQMYAAPEGEVEALDTLSLMAVGEKEKPITQKNGVKIEPAGKTQAIDKPIIKKLIIENEVTAEKKTMAKNNGKKNIKPVVSVVAKPAPTGSMDPADGKKIEKRKTTTTKAEVIKKLPAENKTKLKTAIKPVTENKATIKKAAVKKNIVGTKAKDNNKKEAVVKKQPIKKQTTKKRIQ